LHNGCGYGRQDHHQQHTYWAEGVLPLPITTTINGLRWSIMGLKSYQTAHGHVKVRSIQEYHERSPQVRLPTRVSGKCLQA
jgi:hypothetical protein